MPTLVDHVLLVLDRRPEALKEWTLRHLQWETCVIPSAQHEHRNSHTRHEVERVNLGEIASELKISRLDDYRFDPLFDYRHDRRFSPPRLAPK